MNGSPEMALLATAGAAMDVQRGVLDLTARNVAAAQASDGQSYARLVARIGTAPRDGDAAAALGFDPAAAFVESGDDDADAGLPAIVGVRREPGTGDALTEMIAALDAQRAYEANASIFDVGKRLAERTLDMGRS
jgi:flagellar basal body rod protein FlgC